MPRPASIPRTLLLLGALIPIVAALAGAARWVKHTADDTYVRRDSFAIIQAGETERHKAQDDNQRQLIVKLDSANLRLQQIICGDRVVRGCR